MYPEAHRLDRKDRQMIWQWIGNQCFNRIHHPLDQDRWFKQMPQLPTKYNYDNLMEPVSEEEVLMAIKKLIGARHGAPIDYPMNYT